MNRNGTQEEAEVEVEVDVKVEVEKEERGETTHQKINFKTNYERVNLKSRPSIQRCSILLSLLRILSRSTELHTTVM